MMGPRFYILSDDDPPREIPVDDVMTWAEWFEENDGRRFIRDTQIKRGIIEGPWVSTVFIGLNMNYGEGPVLLYETGVFACRNEWRDPSDLFPNGHWTIGDNLDEDRHSTWAEAMEAHERLVEKWGAKWWEDHGDQHDFT